MSGSAGKISSNMATLSVIATPIGNLEDLTFRALRVLKEASVVLCEDTRVTRRLLDHYEIKAQTISYHQHTGELKTAKIIALLREGKDLALVTDAGTPGISDPGARLVSAVRAELGGEVQVVSVPGPSALAAALSIAGDGFDRFLFLGFPPHKKGRMSMLKEIITSRYPSVLYESKHRIIRLLQELAAAAQDAGTELEVTVARELTKMHESLYYGKPLEIISTLQADPGAQKGEFVVLVRRK